MKQILGLLLGKVIPLRHTNLLQVKYIKLLFLVMLLKVVMKVLRALGPQTQASSLQQGPAPGQTAAHPQHQHLKLAPWLWGWAGWGGCHRTTKWSREDSQGRKTLVCVCVCVSACDAGRTVPGMTPHVSCGLRVMLS